MVMRMLGVGTLVVGLIGLGAWGLRMSAVFSPKGIGRQTVPAGREPAGADVTASGVDARTGLVPPTAKVVADLAVAKAGDLRAVDLGAGIKLELRAIPEGKFTMGSPLDGPQHEVKLTGLFWLGRTEVTQGQWQSVMGTNPSNFRGKDLPVENVSYNDAALFCRKLDAKTLLPTGWRFKLPSEAQWEYACRAGTTAEDAGDVNPSAWYSANSGSKTHGVGTKNANAWGLHDMRGNVWEWCADWYGAYPSEAQTNPSGPDEGAYRVYRGGAWGDPSMRCRSTNRDKRAPDDIQGSIGFRVAVVPTTAAFGRKAVPPGR
jgi:formylglycine-generating enzyme required for sulfatase activity